MSQSGLDKPLPDRTEAQARTEKARTDLVAELRARRVERRGYDTGNNRTIPAVSGLGEYSMMVPDPLCAQAADMIEALIAQSKVVPKATLDENCDHSNLNADKTRCLSCGVWL